MIVSTYLGSEKSDLMGCGQYPSYNGDYYLLSSTEDGSKTVVCQNIDGRVEVACLCEWDWKVGERFSCSTPAHVYQALKKTTTLDSAIVYGMKRFFQGNIWPWSSDKYRRESGSSEIAELLAKISDEIGPLEEYFKSKKEYFEIRAKIVERQKQLGEIEEQIGKLEKMRDEYSDELRGCRAHIATKPLGDRPEVTVTRFASLVPPDDEQLIA